MQERTLCSPTDQGAPVEQKTKTSKWPFNMCLGHSGCSDGCRAGRAGSKELPLNHHGNVLHMSSHTPMLKRSGARRGRTPFTQSAVP